jgi:hypothetical protein
MVWGEARRVRFPNSVFGGLLDVIDYDDVGLPFLRP